MCVCVCVCLCGTTAKNRPVWWPNAFNFEMYCGYGRRHCPPLVLLLQLVGLMKIRHFLFTENHLKMQNMYSHIVAHCLDTPHIRMYYIQNHTGFASKFHIRMHWPFRRNEPCDVLCAMFQKCTMKSKNTHTSWTSNEKKTDVELNRIMQILTADYADPI